MSVKDYRRKIQCTRSRLIALTCTYLSFSPSTKVILTSHALCLPSFNELPCPSSTSFLSAVGINGAVPRRRQFIDATRASYRSAGVSSKSARQLSADDLEWADLVLVMERKYKSRILETYRDHPHLPKIVSLDIPDEVQPHGSGVNCLD